MNPPIALAAPGKTGYVLAGVVSLLGLTVAFAWATNNISLIQLNSGVTMKFNTALSFFLTGFALALMSHRVVAARSLAALVAALSILTILQWTLAVNFGIDELIFKDSVSQFELFPGRMALNTSVSFGLAALAIVLYTFRRQWQSTGWVVSVLGGTVFAIGVTAIWGYAFGIGAHFAWGKFSAMALNTAAGMCLVGWALLIFTWHDLRRQPTQTNKRLLVPVATVLIVFNISLGAALIEQESENARAALNQHVDAKLVLAETNLRSFVEAFSRMAARWDTTGISMPREWAADVAQYLASFQELKTIEWVDAGYLLRFAAPVSGKESALNTGVNWDTALRDTLRKAQQDRNAVMVTGQDAQAEAAVMRVYVPVFFRGEFDGFLVGTLDPKTFFEQSGRVISSSKGESLVVSAGGAPLFKSTAGPPLQESATWQTARNLTVYGQTLQFKGSVPRHDQSAPLLGLPGIVTLSGFVFTALILFVIQMMLRARQLVSLANENSQQFKQLFEGSPVAMFMSDAQGRIVMVNERTAMAFGYRPEELVGQPIELLVPKRFRQAHPSLRKQYLNDPRVRTMGVGRELFGVRKDGSEFPLEVGLNPLQTATGLKMIAVVADVTERMRQSAALKKSLATLDRASNMGKIGGWEVDLQSNEITWSDETCRIHGMPLGFQPPMENAINFYAPADRPKIQAALEKAIATGEGWDLELQLNRASGELIWVRALGGVDFENGKPARLVGSLQDINETKLVSEELARRNKELNNFAYVASHDLKAPLRGIDQLATWITEDLGDQVDAATAKNLSLMRVRVDRLDKLLDDLLVYARAGSVEGTTESLNSAALVEDVFQLCRVDRPFSLKLEGSFPVFVASRTPLEQVFRNLISNAMKHHDKAAGEITVKVKNSGNWYEFSVADDGPGIAPEHFERIFGMFQTLRPRDAVEGSGMGLAIVRKTVEAFGGCIWVEANDPKGVKFTFTWPSNFANPSDALSA